MFKLMKAKFKKRFHRKAHKQLKSNVNSKQKHTLDNDVKDAQINMKARKVVKNNGKIDKSQNKINEII